MLIAFVGSVFSPYYAAARRRGPAAADGHVAINLALYGRQGGGWAMTERGTASLRRSGAELAIGPSRLQASAQDLVIDLDERGAPWPRRLQGQIRLQPRVCTATPWRLDAAGHHHWWPIAPVSAVQVDLAGWRWQGRGYLDSNRGSEPLARGFRHWHWARVHLPADIPGAAGTGDVRAAGERCAVVYDTLERDGRRGHMAMVFGADGQVAALDGLAPLDLDRGFWGVRRQTRADAGSSARLLMRGEDGPFYTRSLLGLQWQGRPVVAMQESLDLDRFEQRWVQTLLPFRMPGAWGPWAASGPSG